MTDLTFTINGVDFSSIVQKGEYTTGKIPVTIKRTDLDKVDHTILIRHRGYIEVTLNPLSPAQAEDLFTQLELSPCTVQYFSFQDKAIVQQTMVPSFDNLQDAKKRESGHWVRSIKVSFTEE